LKSRVSWIVLLLVLLLTGQVGATSFYEDESIRLGIAKGWEVLQDDTYVFQGSIPFSTEDHPSRIQDSVAKAYQGKLTKGELMKEFGDEYLPLLVSVLVKEDEDKDLAMTHLYTPSESLMVNELAGWERANVRITKSIGAYYFLNVPPYLFYEIVFLVPKTFGENKVFVTFIANDFFRKTLYLEPGSTVGVHERIQTLKNEIRRLQATLAE